MLRVRGQYYRTHVADLALGSVGIADSKSQIANYLAFPRCVLRHICYLLSAICHAAELQARPLGRNLNLRVFTLRRIVVEEDTPLANPNVAVHQHFDRCG
jgi:hypothetical protein